MKCKSLFLATIVGFTVIGGVFAAPLDFPKYGFQIGALETTPGKMPLQAVMMFLPAKNGFAPNVNVMIQPYAGTIKDYAALSKGQFAEMKLKFIAEDSTAANEWTAEYSGMMQQASLHWYARAVMKEGKVYLITATAKDIDWDDCSADLKKCVNSFNLK
jgi:hypothetical protein